MCLSGVQGKASKAWLGCASSECGSALRDAVRECIFTVYSSLMRVEGEAGCLRAFCLDDGVRASGRKGGDVADDGTRNDVAGMTTWRQGDGRRKA